MFRTGPVSVPDDCSRSRELGGAAFIKVTGARSPDRREQHADLQLRLSNRSCGVMPARKTRMVRVRGESDGHVGWACRAGMRPRSGKISSVLGPGAIR